MRRYKIRPHYTHVVPEQTGGESILHRNRINKLEDRGEIYPGASTGDGKRYTG